MSIAYYPQIQLRQHVYPSLCMNRVIGYDIIQEFDLLYKRPLTPQNATILLWDKWTNKDNDRVLGSVFGPQKSPNDGLCGFEVGVSRIGLAGAIECCKGSFRGFLDIVCWVFR